MSNPAIIALLQNAALLLALVVVFDLLTHDQPLGGRTLRQALVGVILGGLGIGLILTSFQLEPGIVFDTRSVLLGVSGLFLGALPTGVAMAITAAFRLWQGGAAGVGASVILASGGLGIAWRYFRRRPLADVSWTELYGFGVVVHVVMLALMLALPWTSARRVLAGVGLPVLLVYPVATAALGLLLAHRLRRERTRVALAESEARHRSFFEYNRGVMLVVAPPEGTILDANPAACRFYGWTREQLQQMRITQINLLPPEQLQAEMARAQSSQNCCFQFQHRTADGSVRDVEVFSGPMPYGGREVLYSIIIDITARRRAEAALQESATLLRIATGLSRLGGWRVELAAQRVTWTDEVAAIHEMPPGYSPSVKEGMGFYAPEWREKITAVFGACAREGIPYDEEMEIITVRGTRVWVRTVGEAIRDASGAITQVQGAFQDISERKRTEARLSAQLVELRRWHDITLGRELRVMELKREVNELLAGEGRPPRYASVAPGRENRELGPGAGALPKTCP